MSFEYESAKFFDVKMIGEYVLCVTTDNTTARWVKSSNITSIGILNKNEISIRLSEGAEPDEFIAGRFPENTQAERELFNLIVALSTSKEE